MSDSPRDFWPRPVRNCRKCGRGFLPDRWMQKMCKECEEETQEGRRKTMSEEGMRKWIDEADYESLLSRWRNAPVGDPIFQGEMGDYYSKKMAEKRAEVGNDAHVRASKSIGW